MIELMQTIKVNSVNPHDTKHLDSSNFQKTEIGQIPKDWELVELGAVSIISRLAGAEYTSVWRESPSGEIIALRGFNIEKNKINLRDIVRISDKLSRKLKRSRLTKGDVVYPCVGTIGNAAVIYEDDTYHIQQNIARITPDASRVKSEFLSHYLTSSFAEKEVEKFNATSSQPNVLVSSLRQYKVPLPKTLNEQTAIANALSDVDALIQELEKLIAKKQAIKTATMQQLLTGRTRLPPFGFEKSAHHPDGRKKGYKPSELGEIPEDWEVESIGNLVSITTGCRNTQDKIEEGLYPFFVRSQTIERINSFSFDGEAVLTAGDGVGTGKIFHYINGKFDFHQRVYLMYNFGERVDGYFFYIFFSNYFYDRIMSMTAKSSVDSVRREMIADMRMLLPVKEEQNAIATILGDMDKEIQSVEQHLTKTRQIKQGMMQELLTGKTRLIQRSETI
ncbi:restriction endonuclease subunit S [Shewanella sp. 8A]|uniref:restriction endonuclease subunit S n=1 Tax=Shewanella sp. 8A TaxID=2943323 RepID=UPI00201AFFE7|nr:restriction endonuclease subunit S [Shewanella sp. 8A]